MKYRYTLTDPLVGAPSMSRRSLAHQWHIVGAVVIGMAPLRPEHAAAQRKYVDVDMSQPRLWTRSATASDTSLIDPNRIVPIRGMLILTDPKAPAVLALDETTGRTLWRYAPRRGHGPGEMLQPDGVAYHTQGVLVSDNVTHRLYLLSATDGRLVEERDIPGGDFVNEMCTEMDGAIILNIGTFHGTSLVTTRLDSRRSADLIFPYDTGTAATGLDFIIDVSPIHTGKTAWQCFGARKAAEGMAILPATILNSAKPFIERVRQRPSKPANQVRDTSDLPIPFSLRTGELDGKPWVWFGGSECRHKCIDFYAMPNLRYVATARFVNRMGIDLQDLAIDGDVMYVLGNIGGAPTVTCIRFPRAAIK